ncbi:MAG: SpoIIE family protein phosphatase [Bacteroidota bacterium]
MKKKIKYFIYFLLLFFFCNSLTAQQEEIDSLRISLITAKEDTTKIQICRQLCFACDSLFYAEEALKLANKINHPKSIANSQFTIGVYYYFHEKYDNSLDYLIKAKRLAEANGYKKLLASIYKFIGFIYRPNEPNVAIEYYAKSLRIFNDLKDEHAASYILSAIGNVYEGTYGIDDDDKGEHNALEYYLKSLEIRERVGIPAEIAASLNETSRMYEKLGNHTKASALRQKGLTIAEKAGSEENIIYLCNLIGIDFLKLGNYNKALEYQLKAYKLVSDNKNKNYTVMSEVVQSLAYTYSELKNFQKAAEFYHLYIVCNDSMKARTNNVNFINLKHTLATEQEKQNLLIKDVEIEKQKAIVDKQIVLRNAFLIGFALVIALVIFILRGYRQKQRANRELDITNKKIENAYRIIEEKTKAITDSIHYALRIQRATLPHRSDILAALQHSFVLYKPKDIVSGDFYWFAQNEQKILIAAVDCTGHGVPGAFMSIVGSERLNDAIRNENNPSTILSLLNKGIKASLRQSENAESTRDGMDLAFCSIDLKTNIIEFSGANRPLWIIRKDSTLIEEIKATKVAIGGLTKNDQYFETHTVQLQKGDTFYIFTDGYADQFGGPEGKKLTSKKFREILLSIKDLAMKEQEKHLDLFVENWKKGYEQVDDILIIGIRV